MESKTKTWAGLILGILPALMLALSAVMKLKGGPEMEQGMNHLGWPVSRTVPLAILELSCTLIYLIPRTAVLGAILVTAFLGGAVAVHVRVGDPFYIQVLLGVCVWAGLYLRDPRVRALIPVRS